MAIQQILLGAGAAVDPVYIDNIFETHLYAGNNSTITVNNGIDLSNEGGMVWIKNRNAVEKHYIFDTERGVNNALTTISNAANVAEAKGVTAFNSNGVTIGEAGGDAGFNATSNNYVSYIFRKQKKFFDVVTWTGNDTNRTIAHNLGCVPGCIIVKCTTGTASWHVYHRKLNNGTNPQDYKIYLDTYDDKSTTDAWNDTAPTATHFSLSASDALVNGSGDSFVAYLFAHNDGDGGFGEGKNEDIIKCGSYTGTGATNNVVTLGFEPEIVILKNSDSDASWANWKLYDSKRGVTTSDVENYLLVNKDIAEEGYSSPGTIDFTPTGFTIIHDGTAHNASGSIFPYIAIAKNTGQKGKTPTAGTDVFNISAGQGATPGFLSGFTADANIAKNKDGAEDWYMSSRLTGGKYMVPNGTNAESTGGYVQWDMQTGFGNTWQSNYIGYLWKRHAGFDVVTYTGTGSATTISHSLGKVPEMMWIKNRGTAGKNWQVYHKGMNGGTNPEQYRMRLNSNVAEGDYGDSSWNDTAPTSAVFTVGTHSETNGSGEEYIAYLFASVEGISKCGFYTGTGFSGNTQTLGFQPRFIIQKRANSSSSWNVLDSVRGITDHRLEIDGNDAEDDGTTCVSVSSTGFTPHNAFLNAANDKYIYYAHS